MSIEDIPKVDSLETLQLNIDTIRESGGKLNPELIEFVDNVYELASKLYMMVHKEDTYN
jgi:hypothetical protein